LLIRTKISSQAKPGFVHQVLSCPEFIKQGSPIKDLAQPHSRIIGSCLTKPSWAVAAVKRLCSGPESEGVTWQVTDTATAELTKLASNTLLAQRISNANAIADMCEHHGCDIDDLRYTLEGDARLNSSLATESIGFGGTCLRKDVDWMSFCFDQSGLTDAAKYWRDINHVNTSHIRSEAQRVIQQIRQETNNTDCAKVAILGFAFKKNTDEMKTSSAVPFVRELLKHGCHVRVYDPRLDQAKLNEILEQYRGSLPFGALKTIKVFQRPLSGPLGACKGAHAVVLHTPWEEFKITNFDWIRVHQRMKAPKVLMLGRDRINPHGWRALGFKVLEIGVVGPGEVLQHHD
jgi:UDPglucose 6-dehydrogenase